ncbi:MAG: hypothetical protein N2053_05470 [Chitinispirillaceae bacterium]|nr:hypothetical protein [Chitinispirillaceae bacterium]
MKKTIIISIIVGLIITGGLVYFFVFGKNLRGRIVIPYIAHQKPKIDPHIPSSIPIADKLDEVVFDGLFNVSANPSGIVYEDGLGELIGVNEKSIVTVRLKPTKKWHSSYRASLLKKEKIEITDAEAAKFISNDLRFTLRRIQSLGSISPDYILVSQAIPDFDFSGPNENNEISFSFKKDREWVEADIKEVLSFKILPENSDMNASEYKIGTGPYLYVGEIEDRIFFHKTPDGNAVIPLLLLKPFIDNSTYTTELKNKNINALLSIPFGSISPILRDTTKFFYKSSISTCFFAILYNVNRLSLEQRKAVRALINNKKILDRFFRIGTPQQRHIANYRGEGDNYEDYLNYSVFPTTSYYIEEEVVVPVKEVEQGDVALLKDTVRIQTCVNADFREELSELVEILNDPAITGGKIKVTAVQNEEIRQGNYDGVLVPFTGYRSNFLFDLYNVFLREPDFETYKINLITSVDKKGKQIIRDESFTKDKNFCRIDLKENYPESQDMKMLLEYIFNFMSTREIGDKQVYARYVDELEYKLSLGSWLFSLPSLAYFSRQFDSRTVDLYGTASQLSTIEKWQERKKR